MYFSNMPLTRKQKKEEAKKDTKVDKHLKNCIVDDSKFQEWCNLFQDISQKMQGAKQLCKDLYHACARYDKLLSEKSIN